MDFKDMKKKWDKNDKALVKEDRKAKEKGCLVGRYIQEPFADGYAFYKIVKENKKTVVIEVIKNLGDDWVIPYWGEKTTIDKRYAIMSVEWRDKAEKIFS